MTVPVPLPLAAFFNESKPEEFVAIFAVLAFLLVVALTVKQLVRREPPLHREFATTESVNALAARVDRLEQEIARNLAHFDEMGVERSSKLHERINVLLAGISRIEGEVKRLPCSDGKDCR